MLTSHEPVGGQIECNGKVYRLEVWVYSGRISRIIKRSFAADVLKQANQAIEECARSTTLNAKDKDELISKWMDKAIAASHHDVVNVARALSDPDCLTQVILEASPDIETYEEAAAIVDVSHVYQLPNTVMAAMGMDTLKNSLAPKQSGGSTATNQTTTTDQTPTNEPDLQPAKT